MAAFSTLALIGGGLLAGAVGATALARRRRRPAEQAAAPAPIQTEAPEQQQAAAPLPPPSVPQMASKATSEGYAAGIRQRKRAAAGGNPLAGRGPGGAAARGSYTPRTLIGS